MLTLSVESYGWLGGRSPSHLQLQPQPPQLQPPQLQPRMLILQPRPLYWQQRKIL